MTLVCYSTKILRLRGALGYAGVLASTVPGIQKALGGGLGSAVHGFRGVRAVYVFGVSGVKVRGGWGGFRDGFGGPWVLAVYKNMRHGHILRGATLNSKPL